MPRQAPSIAAVIVLTTCSLLHAESGQPRIEHLGSFFVTDVSGDGKVVVGTGDASGGQGLVRWEAGVAEVLGRIGDHTFANGVSGDGSVIVGEDYSGSGIRWTRQTGLESFGAGGATDASFDGAVIIGDRYRWTQQAGFQPLTPDETLEPSPRRINADGSVVVGIGRKDDYDVAFRWTPDGGLAFLPDIPTGGKPHHADALTPDGSVVVGTAYRTDGFPAFRWTAAGGSQALPQLPNHDDTSLSPSSATAVTPDGNIVFGYEPVVGPRLGRFGLQTFIWDETHGTRPLQEVLQTEYGVDLTGWYLESVAALSYDGTTLVGNGSHPTYGDYAAFRIIIPEPSAIAWLSLPTLLLRRRR